MERTIVKGKLVRKSKKEYVVPAGMSAEVTLDLSSSEFSTRFRVMENASLVFRTRISGTSSFECDCLLEGSGAKTDFIHNVLAENKDVVGMKGGVRHTAHNTSSTLVSRAVADGSAKVDFSAFAYVGKEAPGAKSRVELKALVLKETADVRADPVLEILNDDVECSHAASVAEIDPQKLFYLQSRGISEEQARKLIVNGFLAGGICWGF